MKKALAIGILLGVVVLTGCMTIKKNGDYYHGPATTRGADQATEPSPGWSVAQEAVRQNPDAGVHFKSGRDEFDYYPPNGSGNGASNQPPQQPQSRNFGGWFVNKSKSPVTVQFRDSENVTIETFIVPSGQCHWVETTNGSYPWTATNNVTGESTSNSVNVPSPKAPVRTDCGKPGDFAFWVYDK